MGVYFICDLLIDRLHCIFMEQKKLRDAYATMVFGKNGWIQVTGDWVHVGGKLPYVSMQACRLAAADFETKHLDRLIAGSADVPTLTFISDLLQALSGEVDEKWLEKVPEVLRDIFPEAEKVPEDSCLSGATREQFRDRYHHHHSANEHWYTSFPTYSNQHFIDQLYTAPVHKDIAKLSVGLPARK
jgi:hypothetical protein